MGEPTPLPRRIKVGPYTYTVDLNDGLDDAELRGITDTDLHQIRLNPGNPPALMRSTLLHEAIHAVAVSCARITCEEKLVQEDWIGRIEAPLTALLRDNPQLLAYLTAA